MLLAPSWGPNGILSKYGGSIIDALLKTGYRVIIRPHPQSFTSEKEMLEGLMRDYPETERLTWDQNIDNFEVLRMSAGQIIYQLILGPLELLFDVVYSLGYQMAGNPGIALIFLSLAINFLVLPLYRRADAMQEEERQQTLKMKPGIDHIKKVFKGDERFMILQTYYRQNNYKPYYALKGSLSLLLQIPFFIAAYRFLSGLDLLQGAGFGPISDLGKPDELLRIGGYSLHLLPILMTVINIVSGAIYTKGMPAKSKIQLYGMALVFLVLLYDSPAGLVFYWTLNNLFSLLKNIFCRLPNPKKAARWMCSAVGVAGLICLWFIRPIDGIRAKIAVGAIALMMQYPLIKDRLAPRLRTSRKTNVSERKDSGGIFYGCCVLLTLLLGVLIPSAVVSASPGEFVEMKHFLSPLWYVLNAGLLAAGTFLIWVVVFYRLSAPETRKKFSLAAAILSAVAVIDYMLFGKGYGNLSPLLKYDLPITISIPEHLLNLLIVVAVTAVVFLVWKKKPELLKAVCIAGCVAMVVMSGMNLDNAARKTETLRTYGAQQDQESPRFQMSTNGKNVVVLMLDRAVNSLVPYILNEKPELQEKFAGFTYYPNTLSYGAFTNVGSPPLYGGYDYIPDEINGRPEVSLKDKQNEALKIMPINFYDQGYQVTVCDPTYANYEWIPDLSIYDDYPGINTYATMQYYTGMEDNDTVYQVESKIWKRNFLCYSFFRAVPLVLQDMVYGGGSYHSSDMLATSGDIYNTPQVTESVSVSRGVNTYFMKSYGALTHLPEMTRISEGEENTFLMMSNDATHEPMLLQTPDYVPRNVVDNTAYDAEHEVRYPLGGDEPMKLRNTTVMITYHATMAAFIQLGNWFDYLRESGVWDNTRIILVADHGRNMGMFNMTLEKPDFFANEKRENYLDTAYYNPLLMVKDFDSKAFTTDYSFMTNADTPLLAFSNLIENPVNPFLGKPVEEVHKEDEEQHVVYYEWDFNASGNGYTFERLGENDTATHWLTLRNKNIFDLNNWTVEPRK